MKKCEEFVKKISLSILTKRNLDQDDINPSFWYAGDKNISEIESIDEFLHTNTNYLYNKLNDIEVDVKIYFKVKEEDGDVYYSDVFYNIHEILYNMFPNIVGDVFTVEYEKFLSDVFSIS